MTGLKHRDRIVSIAAWELLDKKISGNKIDFIVNPEIRMPQTVIDIHGITNEQAAQFPFFAEVASEIVSFIGKSPIVMFAPPSHGDFTDSFYLNKEMEISGYPAYPPEQFVNAHAMSKRLYRNSSLNAVLDEFGIDRSDRINKGHSAGLDSFLLAQAFPRLDDEYKMLIQSGICSSKEAKAPSLAEQLRKLNLG